MSLNQDQSKQGQEIMFSCKVLKVRTPLIINITKMCQPSQKNIGIILNECLTLRAL